ETPIPYDGEEHSFDVEAGPDAEPADATIGDPTYEKYDETDGTWKPMDDGEVPTEPGKYRETVVISSDDPEYKDTPISVEYEITKAPGENAPGYAVPGPYEVEYAEGKTLADYADVIVLPEGWAWADDSTPVVKGESTYPANYTPADAEHYEAVTDVPVTVIAKGDITGYDFADVETPIPYDGEEHSFEVEPGQDATPADATIGEPTYEKYDETDGTWKPMDDGEVPTEPGKYRETVVISSDDPEYKDTPISVEYEITKAPGENAPGYAVPGPYEVVYEDGKTLADYADVIVLPEGWEWVDPTTPVEEGQKTYPANYTPADAEHYEPVTDVPVTVTATAPAETEVKGYSLPENQTFDYTGTPHSVDVVAGQDATPDATPTYTYQQVDPATGEAIGDPTNEAPTEPGTYKETATVSAGDLEPQILETTFTINPEPETEVKGYSLPEEAKEFPYDGEEHSVPVEKADGATEPVEITYEYQQINPETGEAIGDPTNEAPTEPGTYKETVTVSSGDLEPQVLETTFTIKNPVIEGYTMADKTVTRNGQPQTIDVTAGANATPGVKIAYSYFDNNGDAVKAADVVEKGTYKVKAHITKAGYEPLDLEANLTIKTRSSSGPSGGGKPTVTNQTVTLDNGDGTTNTVKVPKGDKLAESKATPKDREGYEFDNWYEDPEFTTPYDFNKAVENDITLYAKYEEKAPTPPPTPVKEGFEDIDGHWAEDEINDAVDRGIFEGYGDGTFRPDLGITRQEIAVAMVRLLGLESEVDSADLSVLDKFSDRDEIADWAEKYVALAVEKNIYEGYLEGYFAPERIISREELSTVLTRTAHEPLDREASFTDIGTTTNEWASPYIAPMAEAGVVNGYPDGTFLGKNQITRAEAAAMISRFAAKYLD
ncbi:MAG: S-layer homology domain-containing protein, partial [Clostridia bacterium]|nr:S-layer homology domain-containing protein [Clostridia bacterium]